MVQDSYVEIDLDAVYDNTVAIINNFPDYDYYIGVVKGNAYGHGFYTVQTMKAAGINYFALSCLEEALAFRQYDTTSPCLILEPIPLEDTELAIKHKLSLTVSNAIYGEALLNTNFRGKVHIKVDSGMNRLGFNDAQELKSFVEKAKGQLDLEGIYTHMASVGFYDAAYDRQVQRFESITGLIDLMQFKIVHIDRSLTFSAHPKLSYANGIRPGIMLYGYNQMPVLSSPLKQQLRKLKHSLSPTNYSPTKKTIDFNLSPALTYKSRLLEIKACAKNEAIGYGGQYIMTEDGYIAIVAIGYADGLMLSHNCNHVTINGRPYPIVGSINMKMISVLVDNSISLKDIAVLYGDGASLLKAARNLHVTTYKLLCDIPENKERRYYKQGQLVYSTKEASVL